MWTVSNAAENLRAERLINDEMYRCGYNFSYYKTKEEIFDSIRKILNIWPRYDDQWESPSSEQDRQIVLQRIEKYFAFWFRTHNLKYHGNVQGFPSAIIEGDVTDWWASTLTAGNRGIATVKRRGLIPNPFYETTYIDQWTYTGGSGVDRELFNLLDIYYGTNIKGMAQPEYTNWKATIYPKLLVEWVEACLDAKDLATYQALLKTRKTRSEQDSYILGVRSDVFASAFQAVATTAIVATAVVGTAGAISGAIAGAGATGAATGSGTLLGSTGLLSGTTASATGVLSTAGTASLGASTAITTTAFTAAEIAGVGTAASGGLWATITGAASSGLAAAETAIGAQIVSQVKDGINNLINPPVETPQTVSTQVEPPKNSNNLYLIAGAALAAALFFI